MPKRGGVGAAIGISIECVNGVILGRYEDYIVRRAIDGNTRQVQRLRVNLAVDRLRKQLAKLRRIHVGGIQDGLVEILSRTANIVLISRYIDLRRCAHAGQRQSCQRKNSPETQGMTEKRTVNFRGQLDFFDRNAKIGVQCCLQDLSSAITNS